MEKFELTEENNIEKKQKTIQIRAHISTCLHRTIDGGTAYKLHHLMAKYQPAISWSMNFDALIDRVRSQQATLFLNNPEFGDVLIFLDDDIIFEPDDMMQLIVDCYETKAVIGGLYVTRSNEMPHPAIRLGEGTHVKFEKGAPLTEIIYASTGFMAIHRSVLEDMARKFQQSDNENDAMFPIGPVKSGPEYIFPFFTPLIYNNEYLSEDWAFCERAKQLGYRIYLDPAIRLQHVGSRTYTLEDLEIDALTNTVSICTMTIKDGNQDITRILNDLSIYYDIPISEIVEKVRHYKDTKEASQKIASEWNTASPKNPEEVINFYKNTDYVWDLAEFNLRNKFWPLIYKMKRIPGRNIVDFGGGIGTVALTLQESGRRVTYVDIEGSPHYEFAKWRFDQHNQKIKMVNSLENITEQDGIVCLDVIEHLHPETVPTICKQFFECLNESGIVVWTIGPPTEEYPMHFDNAGLFKESMLDAGFEQNVDGTFVKPLTGGNEI